MSGVDSLIELADRFGVIEAVKAKLVRQPDPAADKLVAVLEEISKIYGAIESELATYLAVSFDQSQTALERNHERASLVKLEGGEISARMGSARGHCEKILNIYHRFLSPWFDSVLNADESKKLHELFELLAGADGNMLDAIDQLAVWLSREANTTLDLVDEGKLEEANQRIKEARKAILPQRRSISGAMRSLHDIEAEFIGISGAVGSGSRLQGQSALPGLGRGGKERAQTSDRTDDPGSPEALEGQGVILDAGHKGGLLCD